MSLQLEIRDLTKEYGEKKALDSVSLVLTEGVYGLLGPNGAGKSTLMNIIAQITKQTSGEVLFDEQNISDMGNTYKSMLGFMPQQQGMYEYFTGYRFLYYMAALKGVAPGNIKSEVLRVAERVNLQNNLKQKIRGYSGGMKQRLLIAQALLNEPRVVLFDEATAGLDPKIRIEVRNLISEIARDKIVLIATHVVQDVEYIARKLIVMRQGKLVACDTVDRLLSSMDSKVYEMVADYEDVRAIENQYIVSNMLQVSNGIRMRIIAESLPELDAQAVPPSLEDYYLYTFEGKK
ncbi:MAG: ATP-binding cassette domain-containing protein [Wujia sp.]